MHVSIVPTGPPRHGKNGFTVAGACPAIWSSTCFLAASFMPSPMPPIKDAIASREKLEVSIARYCENADATRRLEPKPPANHNSQQHHLSSVLYIAFNWTPYQEPHDDFKRRNLLLPSFVQSSRKLLHASCKFEGFVIN